VVEPTIDPQSRKSPTNDVVPTAAPAQQSDRDLPDVPVPVPVEFGIDSRSGDFGQHRSTPAVASLGVLIVTTPAVAAVFDVPAYYACRVQTPWKLGH
jgi:hypothetical protein